MSRRGLVLAVLTVLALFTVLLQADEKPAAKDAQGAEVAEVAQPKFTNRLAKETSPYLLLHAHNPVDWYPWGPEAFAKAKKENKLIFLSIGYSSCYWCHVMERESFDNDEVAKLLNEHFVCIKVDREERPDVDQIYMTALHVLRRARRLAAVDVPDCPTASRSSAAPTGRPTTKRSRARRSDGFKSILKLVHDDWKEQPKKLTEAAGGTLAGGHRSRPGAGTRGIALVELDRELVAGAVTMPQGGVRPRARRLRLEGAQVPRPQVPACRHARAAPAPPGDAAEGSTRADRHGHA